MGQWRRAILAFCEAFSFRDQGVRLFPQLALVPRQSGFVIRQPARRILLRLPEQIEDGVVAGLRFRPRRQRVHGAFRFRHREYGQTIEVVLPLLQKQLGAASKLRIRGTGTIPCRLERFSTFIARASGQVARRSGPIDLAETLPDQREMLAAALPRGAQLRVDTVERLRRALRKLSEGREGGDAARVLGSDSERSREPFRGFCLPRQARKGTLKLVLPDLRCSLLTPMPPFGFSMPAPRLLGVAGSLPHRMLGFMQTASIAHHRILPQLLERSTVPRQLSLQLGVTRTACGDRLFRDRVFAASVGKRAASVIELGLSLAQHARLAPSLDARIDPVAPAELRHRIVQSLVRLEGVVVFIELGHRLGNIFQCRLRQGREGFGQGRRQGLLVRPAGELRMAQRDQRIHERAVALLPHMEEALVDGAAILVCGRENMATIA